MKKNNIILATAVILSALGAKADTMEYKLPNTNDIRNSDFIFLERKSQNDLIEKATENLDVFSKEFGRFYGKAGMAVSHKKVLNLDLEYTVNLTTTELKIGYNGAVFADAELKNKTYLFAKEDSILTGFSVIQFAKAGTFASNVKETKNVEKFDEFGDMIPNSTETTNDNKRFSKAVVGLGFGIEDTLFLTGTEMEFTFGKGLGMDVQSETDFKVSTPLYFDSRIKSSLEVGVRYTRTDLAGFNSATIKFNIAF